MLFYPICAPTHGFVETPTIAAHSKLFLLVANNSIVLNEKGEIFSPGLYHEIAAFYNAHFNERTTGLARVFAFDGLSAQKANSFHIIFSGSPHFVKTDEDIILQL